MNIRILFSKLSPALFLTALFLLLTIVVPLSALPQESRAAPSHSIGQAAAINFMTTRSFTRAFSTQSQMLADADLLSIQYILNTSGNTATIGYQESNDNTTWFTRTTLAAGVVSGTNIYTVTPQAMYQRLMVGLSNTTAVTMSFPGMVK